jgi:ERF superfamily
MQRSSTKIGALATALAKAQCELANPEKSLTATLPSAVPGGSDKGFRYASLASGLDLVRKCLGRHEIATVQATAIDRDSGLIRLTTTLVHASGEWLSSDWPVCAVTQTARPHQMGAALTYARRYALFTLVGIAGEDDLDAPDLAPGSAPSVALPEHPTASAASYPRPAGSNSKAPTRTTGSGPARPALLSPVASAHMRNQLLAELAAQTDIRLLTSWAHKALPRKNELRNADAQTVESAFAVRLCVLGEGRPAVTTPDPDSSNGPNGDIPTTPDGGAVAPKVVTVLAKPARERDRGHLKFVAGQPCLVCGRTPCDSHHIKFAENWTVGRKVSDRFTVPLCRLHHHELHRSGNERLWWRQKDIGPLEVAKTLWVKTHASAPDKIADNPDHPNNGSGLVGPADPARLPQNYETKPIA